MNKDRSPRQATRLRLSYRRVLLAMLFMVIGLLAFAYLLTRSSPTWYQPPDPLDGKVVELADKVEFRLLEEFQKIREEPTPWKLRVREEQINAWLATKLRSWIEHQPDMTWPDNLEMPQIRFEPNGISLAISIESTGAAKVVVTRLIPRFEDGELYVSVDRFALGRLNVPGNPIKHIVELVDQYTADLTQDEPVAQLLLRMLKGEEHIDPILDLADSRRVRLTNLQLEHGSIVLTAVTLSDSGS
ncbi:MAG: hypothetical protein O7G85_05235 [Planctomycetota bacterium]|nr:hypothetical protein [Planctomycetota bacterium]